MSVVAARMWCMAEGRALRRIADPVVAGAPAGVRIRTRIHPTAAEAEVLSAIGMTLGGLYRGELAGRIGLGRLDRKAHAVWRAQRKQALTSVSSSPVGRERSLAPWRISTSWVCGAWRPGSRICAPRWRCSRLGACCVPVTAPVADIDTGGRSRGRRVGIATPRSGLLRPAVWRCCGSGWAPPRRRWGRVGRRWRWAGNGCGATATTSTPPA